MTVPRLAGERRSRFESYLAAGEDLRHAAGLCWLPCFAAPLAD